MALKRLPIDQLEMRINQTLRIDHAQRSKQRPDQPLPLRQLHISRFTGTPYYFRVYIKKQSAEKSFGRRRMGRTAAEDLEVKEEKAGWPGRPKDLLLLATQLGCFAPDEEVVQGWGGWGHTKTFLGAELSRPFGKRSRK